MVSSTSILVCFCLTIVSVASLTCIPCDTVDCPPISSYDCPLGVVEKMCGCCHECIKGAGEQCGGSYNLFGTCNDGLTCVGGYLWLYGGICKTPEEIESDRTSTTSAPSHGSPPRTTTRPPWDRR